MAKSRPSVVCSCRRPGARQWWGCVAAPRGCNAARRPDHHGPEEGHLPAKAGHLPASSSPRKMAPRGEPTAAAIVVPSSPCIQLAAACTHRLGRGAAGRGSHLPPSPNNPPQVGRRGGRGAWAEAVSSRGRPPSVATHLTSRHAPGSAPRPCTNWSAHPPLQTGGVASVARPMQRLSGCSGTRGRPTHLTGAHLDAPPRCLLSSSPVVGRTPTTRPPLPAATHALARAWVPPPSSPACRRRPTSRPSAPPWPASASAPAAPRRAGPIQMPVDCRASRVAGRDARAR